MQFVSIFSVILFTVAELECAEIQRGNKMVDKMTISLDEMLMVPKNVSMDGDQVRLRDDDHRRKRAQGPITELYGCLLTLFLNPACWNRFENNQLRYLQYLYLRRRLQMMEQQRLHGMNATASATDIREGKGPLTPPQDIPLYAKVLMRYFPALFHKMVTVQTKAQGVQKVVLTQAAQAKGFVHQTFAATAAQARALVPVVQQRVIATAGMAKALVQQTLGALAAPPGQAQGQPAKSVPMPRIMPMRS